MLTPAVMVDYRDLKKAWKELDGNNYLEKYHRPMKKITGYFWDNTHQYITDTYGIPFAMCLYGTSLTIYGKTGSEHLFNWTILDTPEDWAAFQKKFDETSRMYLEGVSLCSHCGEPMVKDKNQIGKEVTIGYGPDDKIKVTRHYAGYWFASCYCNECYVGEVKYQAEHESYN